METAQEDLLLKKIADQFVGRSTPVFLLDRVMKCVWSGCEKLFAVGASFQKISKEHFVLPLKAFTEIRVYLNGSFYCARISPLKNDVGDVWLYICELVSSDEVLETASRTDAASKVFPLYNSIEYNMASLWKQAAQLQKKMMDSGDYEGLEKVFAIQASLSNISSVTKNAFSYADMLFSEKDSVRIDAGELVNRLAERCNAALAKCGRRIEVICDPDVLDIMAGGRHAVTALVNTVQNALLYSPRDTVPVAAVYRIAEGQRCFVVISITNENVMFTDKDFKDTVNVNFSYQRLGYGIPIIKRFAEECGGSFSMTDNGGRVTVSVKLPAAPEALGSELHLRQPAYSGYDSGVPDILDIKMREILAFFGEE